MVSIMMILETGTGIDAIKSYIVKMMSLSYGNLFLSDRDKEEMIGLWR